MDTDPLALFDAPPAKPKQLLRSNENLRRDGIVNWTLPAWVVRLPSGRVVNTCPSAGVCAKICYATAPTSSYRRFPAVAAAHLDNLSMVLDMPEEWERWMVEEIHQVFRRGVRWVRIHDSGDFFEDWYLSAWLRIARACPQMHFYAYTKEVSRFRRLVEPQCPANFLYLFSLGGAEDRLIDRERDRHAEVFPSVAALETAGYSDQSASDLLSVLGPRKVGIPANRLPALVRLLGESTFGELQEERDRWRDAKNARAATLSQAAA